MFRRRSTLCIFGLIAALSCYAPSFTVALPTQEKPAPANSRTPAGQQLHQFLEALNGNEDAPLRQLFDSSQPGRIPLEERVARLKSLRANKAPFQLVRLLDEQPYRVVALLQDREGERVGLMLEVAPNAPHFIQQIRLGDPEGLRDARPVKAYTQWKDLADLLTQIRADNPIPAMAAAMVQEGKITDWAVVGVRAQGRPEKAQRTDLWHVGSIGKAMTATLIATLIEQGKLRWDTPLEEALPRLKMHPGYRRVTITQLLQHRGGIPQAMSFTRDEVERITRGADTPTAIRAAYLADVLQKEPIGKPGERFAYSNAGYTLLGYIAERVTGKPYERLMQERVFGPLGMKTATVSGSGEAGQPQGHAGTPNGPRLLNMEGKLPLMVAPAGNIRCSIEDLARFTDCHLQGLRGKGRLLKPETFRRLHTPPTTTPGEEQYACGWEIVPERTSEPFHGHGGSNGTFRAHIALFPQRNLAVVAAQNVGGESEPSPPLQVVLAVVRRSPSR